MTDGLRAGVSGRYECSFRMFRQDDRSTGWLGRARRVGKRGIETCFSLQNIAEFWNVCTRPVERNGYGLSSPIQQCVEDIERQ